MVTVEKFRRGRGRDGAIGSTLSSASPGGSSR